MRAREFLTELRSLGRNKLQKGQQHPTHEKASPGHLRTRGYYDMYRAAMAVAGMDKDGNMEFQPDPESWLGTEGFVGTYTEEERNMAKQAYKALGMAVADGAKPGSEEPDAVNTKSPIKGFKGYPR